MAKSFFRNVTDQIIGGGTKAADAQVAQAIDRFEDEYTKLSKFKREFDKYTNATLIFDNASYRFFDFLGALPDSTWVQQQTLSQLCIDIRRIRGEHLQILNTEIVANISQTLSSFNQMRVRIDEQNRVQHNFEKTQKQFHSSVKRDEPTKVDRIRSDLDQLKSALNLLDSELRDELPKFHRHLQNHYEKLVTEIFGIHGKYYKNFQKQCTRFNKTFQKNMTKNPYSEEDGFIQELQSSRITSTKKNPNSQTSAQQIRPEYKVLHLARVTHDYVAENEDEIDLVKDEYISVIAFHDEEDNIHDQGWEYAVKSDGTIGLFPVNFATRLYDNEEKL